MSKKGSLAALLWLTIGSSACSVLLGLDDAEFDPGFEGGGGSRSGAAGSNSAGADVVAGSAGVGGASDE